MVTQRLLGAVNDRHFIQFRDLPLLYGRVPKVANSSIKACLCRLLTTSPEQGSRTTSDAFWSQGTHGETSMMDKYSARMCRGTHFSFSFVRNPFDRLVSAYNNKFWNWMKFQANESHGTQPQHRLSAFLEPLQGRDAQWMCISPPKQHSLPRRATHTQFHRPTGNHGDRLAAARNMLKRGLPSLGSLPEKNRRRSDDHVSQYFRPRPRSTRRDRFGDDLDLFMATSTFRTSVVVN